MWHTNDGVQTVVTLEKYDIFPSILFIQILVATLFHENQLKIYQNQLQYDNNSDVNKYQLQTIKKNVFFVLINSIPKIAND